MRSKPIGPDHVPPSPSTRSAESIGIGVCSFVGILLQRRMCAWIAAFRHAGAAGHRLVITVDEIHAADRTNFPARSRCKALHSQGPADRPNLLTDCLLVSPHCSMRVCHILTQSRPCRPSQRLDCWITRLHQDLLKVQERISPAGILNPGVLLNDDPQAHLRHIKPHLPWLHPRDETRNGTTHCNP